MRSMAYARVDDREEYGFFVPTLWWTCIACEEIFFSDWLDSFSGYCREC